MSNTATTSTFVWISGASSGLGAALARAQPFADAHVVDISRSGGTPGTEHMPADLADPAAWAAVEAHLHARLGDFTGSRAVFIHAAGTLEPVGFAGEVESRAYHQQVLLNAAAGQALGHGYLAALSAASYEGHADLVMITSGAASKPYPGWSAYGAGKAALDHWVRTVGQEQTHRQGRCRVWAVAPGVVDTAMQTQIREADDRDFPAVDRFRDLHASGSLVSPEEAAQGIWQLLEDGIDNGTVTDLRAR